jgi:ferritin-like protein
MTTQAATLGRNRTGIATAGQAAHRMIEGTTEFLPEGGEGEMEIARVREAYSRQGDSLGSVPPPGTIKGMLNAAVEGVKGARPTQFIDKLGERLAFERMGVRLYEAIISKHSSFGEFSGGPTLAELQEMMLEEHEHFRLLTDVITSMGGDPTAFTPSADLHATMSKGLLEVVVDPRTTLAQCLEALLVAELSDNECWEALIDMARENGQDDAAVSFERIREDEADHLESVRAWIAAAQKREPG